MCFYYDVFVVLSQARMERAGITANEDEDVVGMDGEGDVDERNEIRMERR